MRCEHPGIGDKGQLVARGKRIANLLVEGEVARAQAEAV